MPQRHILYGWQLSLYSGKTRAYLRYKGIPHVEKPIRLWTMRTIAKRTGAQVMPVVVTPEGEWLQDTSHIMDVLEARFPEAPVVPATPRQRVAAYLLEAWGDEFWLPSAMHYRWSFRENFKLFQEEGGRNLMPFAPRFLRDRIIATGASRMRGFLAGLGITPAQQPTIELWTNLMLDALDYHFSHHPYLLGTKPCIGDFGLIAPLYAHLGRDPYPKRTLIAPRKHLAAWIERMQNPAEPKGGSFLPADQVPETLTPVMHSVFGEFWPQLSATLAEMAKALPTLEPGRGFKRSLGMITIPMAGQRYQLGARPYSLWMAQRAIDAYRALPDAQRASTRLWLTGLGAGTAMRLEIPRLRRMTLHVAPE